MRRRTLALSLAVAAALIAPLPGCGGSDSPSNPTPAPTPTPGPTRTLVTEGSQSDLPPASTGAVFVQVIQTTIPATLEATVDWTFASNPVALVWAQGNCLEDSNCPFLVQDTTTAKPKTITATNLAPGIYSLVVLNLGTTNESVSYQIFFIR